MRSWLTALGALSLLALASQGLARPTPGKKYALLVGVRDYQSGRFGEIG